MSWATLQRKYAAINVRRIANLMAPQGALGKVLAGAKTNSNTAFANMQAQIRGGMRNPAQLKQQLTNYQQKIAQPQQQIARVGKMLGSLGQQNMPPLGANYLSSLVRRHKTLVEEAAERDSQLRQMLGNWRAPDGTLGTSLLT